MSMADEDIEIVPLPGRRYRAVIGYHAGQARPCCDRLHETREGARNCVGSVAGRSGEPLADFPAGYEAGRGSRQGEVDELTAKLAERKSMATQAVAAMIHAGADRSLVLNVAALLDVPVAGR